MTKSNSELSNSRFYMWRAVIAMVHADGVVTPHEMSFVQNSLKDLKLSDAQMDIISQDLQTPQDSYEMYSHITNQKDKEDYFALARAVSWCDGDLDKQEKLIIQNLEKSHMNEESMNMLTRSRQSMEEVELNQDQWALKTEAGRSNIFSFFSRFATA